MLKELEAFLRERWAEWGLGAFPAAGLSFVLMSDSPYARGAIGILVSRKGRPEPELFIKVARDPDLGETVRHEHELLAAFRERGDEWVRAALPRPLFLERIGGELAMGRDAHAGHTLLGRMARWRDGRFRPPVAERDIRAVVDWLIRFSRPLGVRRPLTQDDIESHVLRKMAAVYADAPRPPAVERYAGCMQALVGTPILLVPLHNDLVPKNVILAGQDKLWVVDWEKAEREGLPFLDLLCFTTWYVLRHPRLKHLREATWRQEIQRKAAWYLDLVGEALRTYAAALDVDVGLVKVLSPLQALEHAARSALPGLRRRDPRWRVCFEESVAASPD